MFRKTPLSTLAQICEIDLSNRIFTQEATLVGTTAPESPLHDADILVIDECQGDLE
jgi:hypothetical protein